LAVVLDAMLILIKTAKIKLVEAILGTLLKTLIEIFTFSLWNS
jgi:hypothetical protein